MNKHVLYQIQNMKEEERIIYFIVSIKKAEDENYKLGFEMTKELTDFLMDEKTFSESLDLGTKVYQIYKEEIDDIIKEKPTNMIPILVFSVVCDSEGITDSIYSPFIGGNRVKEFAELEDSLIRHLESLNIKLHIKLEDELNDFVDDIDSTNTHLYIFNFKPKNGQYSYDSFTRMTDRSIPEQKIAVNELLRLGVEETLITKALEIDKDFHKGDNLKSIEFFANDKGEVFDLKLGYYNV